MGFSAICEVSGTLTEWKSESMTYGRRTDRHTGVGARDTCVLNITHFHISKFLNLLSLSHFHSFTLSLFHTGLLVIVFVTRRRHHRVLIGVRCPGRIHASLNYTITDQLYPRDKNSRDLSVPRVFLSLKTRNPVSLLAWWRHQKVRHMREKAMYTLY